MVTAMKLKDVYSLGFPGGSEVKASACNAGDLGWIPGLGRSPGEGNGNPLQYSCLENPMDWGAWWATVHRVSKSWIRLSDFIFTFLLFRRKAMTNLDSILKSKDITLPTLVKAMAFPVVMYRCESWTIKQAECWRIKAFELWCWRRLLRVPLKTRRSYQSTLKEINPEYLLEGLMLKLKLYYFGHLMWTVNSLERTLMPLRAGGEVGNRGWDG